MFGRPLSHQKAGFGSVPLKNMIFYTCQDILNLVIMIIYQPQVSQSIILETNPNNTQYQYMLIKHKNVDLIALHWEP